MLNKCVRNNNKRIKSQIKRFHQIDIHKSLLLYEGDNGPGKHEEEVQLNLEWNS